MRGRRHWSVVVVGKSTLLLLAAIALIVVVGACGRSTNWGNPAAPSATTSAVPVPVSTGRIVPREVTGTLEGRFDFTNTWGEEWWEFYSDGDVTGTLTHLGLSRMHTRHIPTLSLALEQGTFRIVAANGDEIRGTYEGSASYDEQRTDVVHGVATFAISGGTGRFTEASGTINATFLETLDDPTWASAKVAWTLSGTVSY